jgi:hypothetical protein
MSNVKKGSGSGVPSELAMPGMTGAVKVTPNTIDGEMAGMAGKAKMNFKHPPLGPEQSYEDGEMRNPAGEEDKPSKMGGKAGIKHRSTSGAPGHTITGN